MKLYRSSRDKKLFGLCGGLAEAMGVDATLLRILAIVLAVFTSGGFIIVYILAALVMPKEPPYSHYGHGPGGYGGYPPGGGGYQNPYSGSWKNPGYGSFPPGQGPEYHSRSDYKTPPPNPDHLDAMMDDLEKKALRKEIEELKAKIRKLEKGE